LRRRSPIESLADRLIQDGIFPGLAVVAGRGERILYECYRGNRALVPRQEPLTPDTLFDLASLTKPLVTAFMAAWFIQSGNLRLEDPVQRFLPDYPHRQVTIRHLASHTAGLPDWHPLYLEPRPYLDTIKTLAPGSVPGRRVVYSCPGYILLHFVLERLAAEPFTRAARKLLLEPLNLKDTLVNVPEHRRHQCAPTEMGNAWERKLAEKRCPQSVVQGFPWRMEIIRGRTHDGNSFYLGGCAGNAGLFATARDLFRLSGEFLPQSATLLRREFLELFGRNLTPGKLSHRTLGFKLNSTPLTSAGRALPTDAFGHNGFTGTSLWLDPRSGLRYILLTNRVHPRVREMNFNRVRRRLHKALVKQLRELGS